MRSSLSLSIVLAGLMIVSSQAHAQAPADAPKLFEGTAEVSSVVTNGNTKNQTTGLGFDATYRPAPWSVNLKSKYMTTVSQEVQTQESFEASGRGARNLTDSLETFLEYGYLKNRFAGTDLRHTTTGGLAYQVLKTDDQQLKTEGALGYIHEERTDLSKRGFMTGVVGLLYKLKLSPTADITHETKYLPNFQNSDDWRLSSETSLSSAISSMFSSKISWRYEHVNAPPAGKIRGDTTTTVSILAKF